MSDVEDQIVIETIADIEKIRVRLGSRGSFKLRVLLEMIAIELESERSLSATSPRPDTPSEP
jgi:hypothetical protein